MEKHTYADALRKGKETTRRESFEEIERSSTLESDVKYLNSKPPHAVIQSQTESNHKPSIATKDLFIGAVEAASEDPTPPLLPTSCASSPEELYYLHQVLDLYRRSMKIIHAWLVWEGYGSPGNTTRPTSRLQELAERARRRDAMPGARELWSLEVATDCAKIFQMVEEQGVESKDGQCTSMTSSVAV